MNLAEARRELEPDRRNFADNAVLSRYVEAAQIVARRLAALEAVAEAARGSISPQNAPALRSHWRGLLSARLNALNKKEEPK